MTSPSTDFRLASLHLPDVGLRHTNLIASCWYALPASIRSSAIRVQAPSLPPRFFDRFSSSYSTHGALPSHRFLHLRNWQRRNAYGTHVVKVTSRWPILSSRRFRSAEPVPWARNARTHSKKQIRQIADSIRTFGFTNPVLIDAANTILAGHGRVEAAKLLGMATVPCVRLENMTPAQKRAYVLADNKLAQNAGWDEDLLAEELKGLMSSDLGFDIGVIGFSIPEIDGLVEGLTPEEPGDPGDDWVPERSASRAASRGMSGSSDRTG